VTQQEFNSSSTAGYKQFYLTILNDDILWDVEVAAQSQAGVKATAVAAPTVATA